MQQVISQLPNVERSSTLQNIAPQTAQQIQESAQEKQSRVRTETVTPHDELKSVVAVSDEDKKRKALLTKKKGEKEKQGEEEGKGEKDKDKEEEETTGRFVNTFA